MNTDPVVVDDDVMEPVLIIDDDEDDNAISKSDRQTNNKDVIIISDTNKKQSKKERTFIKCLKSNNLMDKIVKKCLSMENAVGIQRVIDKTLLPLYRDASVRYKESAIFRRLLKKTFKLLVRDPDHKFLHIKTLCEELKSGGLRRKVPFVTLAKNLKHNDATRNKEVCKINNSTEDNSIDNTIVHEHACNTLGAAVNNEKTHEACKCGVVITENNKKRKVCDTDIDVVEKETNTTNTNPTVTRRESSCHTNGNEKTDIINLDNSDNESVISLDHEDGKNEVIIIEETAPIDKESDSSNKENKSFNAKYRIENEKSYDNLQSELLVPKNHVEFRFDDVATPNHNEEIIAIIEKQIATYKLKIAKLEQEEVTFNTSGSPYILCSNLKKKIVDCYKELCNITGNSGDLVRRRKIRLHVAEGHPAGPAKRLEQLLNDTMDRTGEMAFPDFNDVLQCVILAKIHDNLGWVRHHIFQEAVALFRQCGQALRKRRQKREYKDLMSLVDDQTLTEDPAEKDPLLLAKLEENKQIAKVKEEEVLERYVSMEIHKPTVATIPEQVLNPRLGRVVRLESTKDSSDSDSESDIDVTDENDSNITSSRNQIELGESSNNKTIVDNIGELGNITNNHTISSNTASAIVMTNEVCESGLMLNTNNIVLINRYCNIGVRSENILTQESSNSKTIPITENGVIRMNSNNNDTTCSNADCVIDTSNNITTPNSADPVIDPHQNNLVASNSPDCVVPTSSKYSPPVQNNQKVLVINGFCGLNDLKKFISCTSNGAVQNNDVSNLEDSKAEQITIKKEPIDVQSMLDELGDSFECTVFDIEDPFLVIEISSDEFSDDDT